MSEAPITNAAEGSYPTKPRSGHPSKVAIIGAGAVGSTLAYACVMKGVAREVVLQDIAKEKVEAEALDIAHGIQFTPAASVAGSDDVEICRDADVVVITAGAKQKPGQSRLDLAGATVGIMEKILPNLLKVAPNAVYILVANPVDVVTYCSLKISGLPENQMFGSGTVLDTSRLRYLVSLETGTAVQNIHGYIAGEHGDSEVPLWSSAQIGGVPLQHWGPTIDGGFFDQAKRDRIAHDVVRSAYRIIEGKGATNYAVGLAVSRIIGAVLNDEERVLTVSPLLDQWHGISDVCMAVPTIVGREGAGRRLDLPLTLDERDRLTASAERLRSVARGLGY
ncbi:L-lactate dehydrogenase [Actinomyces vulturis]|uniref:L-lactate dehydrogenase n=1 Tax=Actinomyces vulturis TaxID=1857645 RepID=UPI00082DC8B8|nr:L-lactate dehydrogenase [Actinomyces vulturis]